MYSENIKSNRIVEYIAKHEIENVWKQIEFYESDAGSFYK